MFNIKAVFCKKKKNQHPNLKLFYLRSDGLSVTVAVNEPLISLETSSKLT